MDVKNILSKCDHTLLLQGSTWEEMKKICDDGMQYGTASVCIPPSYVKMAKEYVGVLTGVEKRNLERIQKDLKKFCDKHDYRNALEPMGNAETALPRMREKLYGAKID